MRSRRGGVGLNCEAEAHCLTVTSILILLEVGCKKGKRNSEAVRYTYCTGRFGSNYHKIGILTAYTKDIAPRI